MKRHWYWFVCAVLLLIAWCAPVPYRVDIGRFDSAVVSGCYPVEYGAGTSFRWTQPRATLSLAGVGSGPATLQLLVSGAVRQPVTIHVADTATAFIVEPGFHPIQIPIVIPIYKTGRLDVVIETNAPHNDGRRELGIAIDEVRLTPAGWQVPALTGWALSILVVYLGVALSRLRRVSVPFRTIVLTVLVGVLVLLRRGEAHSILTVVALMSALSLATAAAYRVSTGLRWGIIFAVSSAVLAMVWWRGADIWQPLWQLVVLLGSVALFRLRRFVWTAARPYRLGIAGVVLLGIASQSWELAVCAVGAACLWVVGRSADPSRNRLSALLFAAYSIVPTVDAWLRGRGVPRMFPKAHSRSVGLDYLRGLVVLFVLLAHTPTVAVYGNEWVVTIVHWLVKFAVEAFFLLSGWLIGDLVVATLDEWTHPRALALFLHRRWARTLPIYWLVLAMVVLAGWSGATLTAMWEYIVFVQNMWQIHPPYFLVAWSLSIEEWFYLSAAVVLSIVAIRVRPARALLVTLVLLIGIPLVLRSWVSWTTDWSWNDAVRQYVPLRLDAIASGMALVWAWRRWPVVARHAGWWLGGSLVLATGYIGAVQLWQPVWEHTPWVRVSIIPVMSLGIMGIFPFLAGLQRPIPSLVERGLQWISLLSYPLYLLHYPVRQTVLGLVGVVGSSVLGDIVVTVGFYVGSFWLALQWHRELEQPMMRLRLRQ